MLEGTTAEGKGGLDVTVLYSWGEAVSFRRPKRVLLVLSSLTVLVCSVLILQSVLSAAEPAVELGTRPKIFSIEMPKMVDWRTEDAKSDRKLNRHLIVAETGEGGWVCTKESRSSQPQVAQGGSDGCQGGIIGLYIRLIKHASPHDFCKDPLPKSQVTSQRGARGEQVTNIN
jgi:hypothetical protein